MDILKIIAELHAERAAIDEALLTLQRLARTRGNRRGRPPAWMALVRGSSPSPERRTRTLSAETRKRMAEAQKRRWAAYRKAKEAKTIPAPARRMVRGIVRACTDISCPPAKAPLH